MAAFLNKSMDDNSDSSDFEVFDEVFEGNPWDIPPQTPSNQINVKSMYEYEGQYYDPEEVKKFDKPGISKKLRNKIDKIKKGGIINAYYNIVGSHRPENPRRTKPLPRSLVPTESSKKSHKKLMQRLEEADMIKSPFDIEDRTSLAALKAFAKKKGGKKKTKKRRKKHRTKKRNKAGSLRKTKRSKKSVGRFIPRRRTSKSRNNSLERKEMSKRIKRTRKMRSMKRREKEFKSRIHMIDEVQTTIQWEGDRNKKGHKMYSMYSSTALNLPNVSPVDARLMAGPDEPLYYVPKTKTYVGKEEIANFGISPKKKSKKKSKSKSRGNILGLTIR